TKCSCKPATTLDSTSESLTAFVQQSPGHALSFNLEHSSGAAHGHCRKDLQHRAQAIDRYCITPSFRGLKTA
ncbi:MAG: hypothetical protein MJH10_20755, partial [Epibacterium sp.]|nr:hypothetical protein [Epibacterium sp.]